MPVGNPGTVPVESRSAECLALLGPTEPGPWRKAAPPSLLGHWDGKATCLDLESLGLGHFWLVLEPGLLLCLEQPSTHLEGLLMEK